jgi:hypothetical protein
MADEKMTPADVDWVEVMMVKAAERCLKDNRFSYLSSNYNLALLEHVRAPTDKTRTKLMRTAAVVTGELADAITELVAAERGPSDS